MLADDAARDKDKAQRTTRFQQALENMKILLKAARFLRSGSRRRCATGDWPGPVIELRYECLMGSSQA